MFSFVTEVIHQTGALGVGLLMLLENLIPVIPSELIMPMAGYEAANGSISPVWAILAGTAGSIIGGSVWYAVGRSLGLERVKGWASGSGRWLILSPEQIDQSQTWFKRWGPASVCIGRALPGIRGIICIPAGVAEMRFSSFLIWSSLGALIWSSLLVLAGFVLKSHYAQLEHWLNPITDAFLIFAVVAYVVRIVRFKLERATTDPQPPAAE